MIDEERGRAIALEPGATPAAELVRRRAIERARELCEAVSVSSQRAYLARGRVEAQRDQAVDSRHQPAGRD